MHLLIALKKAQCYNEGAYTSRLLVRPKRKWHNEEEDASSMQNT